jgi:hypothetical protein
VLKSAFMRAFVMALHAAARVRNGTAKGLRGNKRFEWIARPPRGMAGPGPATYDLAQCTTTSRGWCAFAHHDTKGPMPRPNRFRLCPRGP